MQAKESRPAREAFDRKMNLQGSPEVRAHVSITYPVWKQYGEKLDWMQGYSPHVGVGINRQSGRAANSEVTDRWDCHWIYPLESLDGICVGHPVATWDQLESYDGPRPEAYTDWEAATRQVQQTLANGGIASGGTDHGFVFLRLTYLRGFENMMMDLADQRPELDRLIALVERYWQGVVDRWIEAGVDTIGFGDDLGLQHALPMRPETWRKYIKPSFARIFGSCRERGVHVSLHTDGYVVDIIPDLIECDVSVLNPQDLVNGLDNLERLAKGKVVLNLDIDRQNITAFGTPEQVDRHIRECIERLGSPTGGLSMIWGVYPGTPLENIEAAVRAMHKYATLWA